MALSDSVNYKRFSSVFDQLAAQESFPLKIEHADIRSRYTLKEILHRGPHTILRRVINKRTGEEFKATIINLSSYAFSHEDLVSVAKDLNVIEVYSCPPKISLVHSAEAKILI